MNPDLDPCSPGPLQAATSHGRAASLFLAKAHGDVSLQCPNLQSYLHISNQPGGLLSMRP